MLQTETTVKANTRRDDRFGGFSTQTAPSQTITEPEFAPFSFGTEVSSEPETAFEVEKQYNFDTTSYQEVSEKKQMQIPTLERKIEHQEQEIVAKTYSKPKLNARGKIMVSVYSIIVAIIVAFCIYNAVSINGLQADVATKNEIVATQTAVITELQNTYNSLGEEDNILTQVGDSFKTPTEADTTVLSNFELSVREKPAEQTNWFEKFCESLRKLFS